MRISQEELKQAFMETQARLTKEMLESIDMVEIPAIAHLSTAEIDAIYEQVMEALEEKQRQEQLRQELARREVRQRNRRMWHKGMVRVASLLLSLLLGSHVVMLCYAQPDQGDHVRKEITYDKEDKMDEITLVPENPDNVPTQIERRYLLGKLPEGYELDQETSNQESYHVIYQRGDEYFLYWQDIISKEGKYSVDSENAEVEDIQISGVWGKKYVKDDAYPGRDRVLLFWVKDNYVFTILGYLPEEEMIRIAEDIQ